MNKDFDEDAELNELLKDCDSWVANKNTRSVKEIREHDDVGTPIPGDLPTIGNLIQWTTSNNKIFVPASYTCKTLTPGVYEVKSSPNIGTYFEKIPIKTEGLIRFPQTNIEKVVKEIELFWSKEDIFREYGLSYKRGIMLWGPPGSGKSCTIQLVMADVINRNGIALKFTYPTLFLEGVRLIREIEKEKPIVVLMEDIDSTLDQYGDTEVLNILDGVDRVEKIVFLATTNYPEKLGHRILNRPSRFDKRFKIGYPNEVSRMIYLKHLIGNRNLNIDLEQWVGDTDKFSLAHLKELFIAVVIIGDSYEAAIKTLRSMKEHIDSEDDNEEFIGFRK
jgi:hypothetical protein